MSRYLVIYASDIGAAEQMEMSEAEGAAEMQAWMTWAEGVGAALLDLGLPLGNAQVIDSAGVARPAPSTAAGYSIVEAASVEAAVELMRGHPHLRMGTIEVHEMLPIPGMDEQQAAMGADTAERRGSASSTDDRY